MGDKVFVPVHPFTVCVTVIECGPPPVHCMIAESLFAPMYEMIDPPEDVVHTNGPVILLLTAYV